MQIPRLRPGCYRACIGGGKAGRSDAGHGFGLRGAAADLVEKLFGRTWPQLAARGDLTPLVRACGARLVGHVTDAEEAAGRATPVPRACPVRSVVWPGRELTAWDDGIRATAGSGAMCRSRQDQDHA